MRYLRLPTTSCDPPTLSPVTLPVVPTTRKSLSPAASSLSLYRLCRPLHGSAAVTVDRIVRPADPINRDVTAAVAVITQSADLVAAAVRRSRQSPPTDCCRPSCLRPVRTLRHSQLPDRRLDFSSLNVRSLENKLDSLYEVRRDHSLDILFLVETWHDSDSTCFCRLRADGHQVIDKPRPRVRDDTLIAESWPSRGDIVYRCASPTSRPGCFTHNVRTAMRPCRIRHVLVCRRRHLQARVAIQYSLTSIGRRPRLMSYDILPTGDTTYQ